METGCQAKGEKETSSSHKSDMCGMVTFADLRKTLFLCVNNILKMRCP